MYVLTDDKTGREYRAVLIGDAAHFLAKKYRGMTEKEITNRLLVLLDSTNRCKFSYDENKRLTYITTQMQRR